MSRYTTTQVAVFVTLTPQPGKLDEVIGIVQGAFGRFRKSETACLQLSAHVSDDGDILLYELWSDEAEFTAFLNRPGMVEYLADLDTRLSHREYTTAVRATA